MAVFDWPMIQCGKQVVHPIHYDKESFPNLKEMPITLPWDIVVLEEEHTMTNSALTKKGDLICLTEDKTDLQKLDKTTGMLQPYCLSPSESNDESPQFKSKIIHIAVDEEDALYILSVDEGAVYTLTVYSADETRTHHCTLGFVERAIDIWRIAITKDKNVVLCLRYCSPLKDIVVYVCSKSGELIHRIVTGLKDDHEIESVSVSCNGEITLTTFRWSGVFKHSNMLHVYASDGKLQKLVKFHPSEGSDHYGGIFYNQVTKNIIGYVKQYGTGKILIESLSSPTAQLQCSYLLYTTILPDTIYSSHLVYHTNGALALVGHRHFIPLQKPSK